MTEFLNNLGSVYWWVSVVIVGVIINIVSAYLVRRMDSRMSSLSSWWRNRSEAKRLNRLEAISFLQKNPHEQLLFALRGIRFRIEGIWCVMFGGLILGGSTAISRVGGKGVLETILTTIGFLAGSFVMIIGILTYESGVNKSRLLEASLESNEPKIDESDAA